MVPETFALQHIQQFDRPTLICESKDAQIPQENWEPSEKENKKRELSEAKRKKNKKKVPLDLISGLSITRC